MTNNKRLLTADEAKSVLSADDRIHTFVNPIANVVIGADWDRSDVVALIEREDCLRKIAGPQARAVEHGLALHDGDIWVFVAVPDEKLTALEGGAK